MLPAQTRVKIENNNVKAEEKDATEVDAMCKPANEAFACAQCSQPIRNKMVLRALDQYWHDSCLKCSYCSAKLADLGSKFYFRGEMILCRRDYIRLFGSNGICSLCFKIIPPLEMVMRARDNVYHLHCFECHVCRHRFCVGDRFYLYCNTVLCEDDYDDFMYRLYCQRNQEQQQQPPPPQPLYYQQPAQYYHQYRPPYGYM